MQYKTDTRCARARKLAVKFTIYFPIAAIARSAAPHVVKRTTYAVWGILWSPTKNDQAIAQSLVQPHSRGDDASITWDTSVENLKSNPGIGCKRKKNIALSDSMYRSRSINRYVHNKVKCMEQKNHCWWNVC